MNLDDLGDHRPGQRAAAERGAAFPLVDAGFTKADVRAWSKELGLRTWDKPAAACLASRLPYGTPVTLGRLALGRAGRGGAARARASASCGCATTATSPGSRCPSADLDRVVAQREAVVDGRDGGRLPLGRPSTSPASAPAASTDAILG